MKKFAVVIAMFVAIMSVMAFGPCETAVATEATNPVAAEELSVKDKLQVVNDWTIGQAADAGIEVKFSQILIAPLGESAVWTMVYVEDGETQMVYEVFDVADLLYVYDYIQMKYAAEEILANL